MTKMEKLSNDTQSGYENLVIPISFFFFFEKSFVLKKRYLFLSYRNYTSKNSLVTINSTI